MQLVRMNNEFINLVESRGWSSSFEDVVTKSSKSFPVKNTSCIFIMPVLNPALFLWFRATRVCHCCMCSPLLTAPQQGRRTPCCCRSSRRIWTPAFSTRRRTRYWSRLSVRTGRWWWWWTASSQSPGWTQHQCQETPSLTHRPSLPSPLPSAPISSSSPPFPWPTVLQLLPMPLLPACCQPLPPLLLRHRGFTLLPVCPTAASIHPR